MNSHYDEDDRNDLPGKPLALAIVFGWLFAIGVFFGLLFSCTAQADVGLATVTRDASVAGKLVKDAQPVQLYAVPKAGDFVRVAPTKDAIWTTGVWKAWPPAVGDKYETCRNDTPPESWANATCNSWDVVAYAPVAVNTTGTITLTWIPPTQNTDGSALTDLAGNWIYSGAAGSPLTRLKQVTGTSSTLTGYKDGTYSFAMTALNTAGTESAQTPSVSVTVKIPVATPEPNPPTTLSVVATTAYRFDQTKTDTPRLFAIGTVPLGTQCDPKHQVLGLHRVPKAAVTLVPGASVNIALAKCG